MIAITLADLRFRARQFVIAVIGASLVFAMAMLLTGLAAGFSVEINQTVAGTGAAAWLVAPGSAGRITSLSPVPTSVAQSATAALGNAGVKSGLIVIAPEAAQLSRGLTSIVVVGYALGGLGAPRVSGGHGVTAAGQAVVDARLKLPVGQRFVLSGQSFIVVGTVHGRTLLGGLPEAYMALPDAQAVAYGGRPLVGAVLASSYPRTTPAGFVAMSNSQVERRTLQELAPAVSSIKNSRTFMWFVAAVIVAALVYVTALERTHDFAVLKALGASSSRLFGGLAIQAVIVSLVSAGLAAIAGRYMTGLFAQPVAIRSSAVIALLVSALVVGLLSSLAALRRAVSVDPSLAFSGA